MTKHSTKQFILLAPLALSVVRGKIKTRNDNSVNSKMKSDQGVQIL